MNTSKVINDFNRCLLREKFYDFKYNINKYKKKKPNEIKTLFETIKNNNSYDEFQYSKIFNVSLTTNDAMNNPNFLKLGKCMKNIENNNYKLNKKRINSTKKNYKIKSLDIFEYSNCVKFSEKRNKTLNKAYENRKKLNEGHHILLNKRNPITLKDNKEFEINSRNSRTLFNQIKDDEYLNIYKSTKFKDNLSSFLNHINNITSFHKYNSELKEVDKKNVKFFNKQLSILYRNNINTNKTKEIKRFEVDTSNIFLIQKPLITTLRGKILKNTKKRFKRPVRNIITDTIFYNHKEH